MHKLLSSVTALSLALNVAPPFVPTSAMAQDASAEPTVIEMPDLPEGAFAIEVEGKPVICLPQKGLTCPDDALCVIAKQPAGCEKRALAKMASQGDAASATTEDASTGTPTTEGAAPDGAATTDSDAGTTAQATTDVTSTETTAPEAPTPGTTAEGTSTEPSSGDTATAEVAPAGTGTTEVTSADASGTGQAEAGATGETVPATTGATETAPTEPTATTTSDEGTAVSTDTTLDATGAADSATPPDTGTTPETATAPEPAPATEPVATEPGPVPGSQIVKLRGTSVLCLPPTREVTCPDDTICVRPKTMDNCAVAAGRKLDLLAKAAEEDKAAIAAAKAAADAAAKAAEEAGQPLIDAPVPTEEAVKSLDAAITTPATEGETAPPVAAAAAADETATTEDGSTPDKTAPAPEAVVTEQKVTEADTRASSQEFAAAPATTADGTKKTGLSDLEKAGLLALGALAIGTMLYGNNGTSNEVVANSGDRVVLKDDTGSYQVLKDDDVLLRQPGSTVRTETFSDGSTRTTVMRDDGTSVVTVRDASGRVLKRSSYDAMGLETQLINDTLPETRIDVSKLPPPGAKAKDYAHQFSLRQVRTIPEIKALAPLIPVSSIRFATGSAAIRPGQAENLADLAAEMRAKIKKNPNKVFLIEGHTDAVGGAAMNLVLSDRRAESVAKALTEYYGVPPENMVVQGYGEAELVVDTLSAEAANRRVVVRDITQLLKQTAKN